MPGLHSCRDRTRWEWEYEGYICHVCHILDLFLSPLEPLGNILVNQSRVKGMRVSQMSRLVIESTMLHSRSVLEYNCGLSLVKNKTNETELALDCLVTCDAWFTFSSWVLVETFGEIWMRRSTHECGHSHSRVRIIDNKARNSRHSRFFDSGLIYRNVSKSFEKRREQVESVKDETNVPFTLSSSSRAVLMKM